MLTSAIVHVTPSDSVLLSVVASGEWNACSSVRLTIGSGDVGADAKVNSGVREGVFGYEGNVVIDDSGVVFNGVMAAAFNTVNSPPVAEDLLEIERRISVGFVVASLYFATAEVARACVVCGLADLSWFVSGDESGSEVCVLL